MKMYIFPKRIYRGNLISINIPIIFFEETPNNKTPKQQKTQATNQTPSSQSNLIFKLYPRAAVMTRAVLENYVHRRP